METSYFNKLLYLKKDKFCIKKSIKASKEATRQGKRLKSIRKYIIDKNKEKEGILCEAGAFDTVLEIF